MFSKQLALALGLSAVNVAAQLSKPALWPDLNFLSAINSIPHPGVQLEFWPTTEMSGGCYNAARRDGKNPANFKQYTLWLGDCPIGWRVCQENGAQPPIDEVARSFARVPVRMRQFTREVIHYANNGGAYAQYGHVVFNGNAASTGTMIHEVTHTVDGSGFRSITSHNQEWLDAYNLDSAVPDNYARSSQTENLAQFPSLIIVDRMTNGQVTRDRPEISRIANQKAKVEEQGDNGLSGGRLFDIHGSGLGCVIRIGDEAIVSPTTGAVIRTSKVRRSDARGVEILAAPHNEEFDAKTNCTANIFI